MNHEMTAETQQDPRQQPIEALLPRYYELHVSGLRHETVESIRIDGHEVAWMHYTGQVIHDITGEGKEGQVFEGHELKCACDFAEGIGWRTDEKYGVIGMSYECGGKQAAVEMRHVELNEEYKRRGILDETVIPAIKTIIMDLIEKRKAGEFLEQSTGASSWGGYYYLQTVHGITNAPYSFIWAAVNELEQEEKIRMEGMVVQTYRPPEHMPVYETDSELPETVMYHERPDKVWALAPRPEEVELDLQAITPEELQHVLGSCIVGLAHTAELARQRLQAAITNPRESHQRLYEQSFVEVSHKAGALAVLAYTPRSSRQPQEWLVEGFVGDALLPEVHTLPMVYAPIFGVDVGDQANLEAKTKEWWPTDTKTNS